MARPKQFDREQVLETAKALFWRQGYAATSTEDLRRAMGLGRQSFYDSFGGKRELFVEVLRRYNDEGVQQSVELARSAPSPLAALSTLLLSFSGEKPERRALGCMGVAAICELGTKDHDVAGIGASSSARLEALLSALLRQAKARGEVRQSVNERAAARQLSATILGMKVMSKAGATPAALRDVAESALEGLAAPTRSRRT